jgi:hypothetical protein
MALTEAQLHMYHLHVLARTLPANGLINPLNDSRAKPARTSAPRSRQSLPAPIVSSDKPEKRKRKGRKTDTVADLVVPPSKVVPLPLAKVRRISLNSDAKAMSSTPRPAQRVEQVKSLVADSSTLPPDSPGSTPRPKHARAKGKSSTSKRVKATAPLVPLDEVVSAAQSGVEMIEEMDVEEVNQLLSSEPMGSGLESEYDSSPLNGLQVNALPPSSPVFTRTERTDSNHVDGGDITSGKKKKKRKSQIAQEGGAQVEVTPVKVHKKRRKALEAGAGPMVSTPTVSGAIQAQPLPQTPSTIQTPGKTSSKTKRKSQAHSANGADVTPGTSFLPPATPVVQPAPAQAQTPAVETSTKKSKKARKSESGTIPAEPVSNTQESSATAHGSPKKKKKRKSMVNGESQETPSSQDRPLPLVPSSQLTAESTLTPVRDDSTKKKKEKRKSLTLETPSGSEKKKGKKEKKGPTWVVETPRPAGH